MSHRRAGASLAALIWLAACGGGGDPAPPDPCAAVGVCSSPPPNSCPGSDSALVYPASGRCTEVAGQAACDYQPILTPCPAGQVCQAGACAAPPDPCAASDVCTTPPAPGCNLSGERVTYPSQGDCSALGGLAVCDYPPLAVPCPAGESCQAGLCVVPPDPCAASGLCSTPPANTCNASGLLVTYPAQGICSPVNGLPSCHYPPAATPCPAGQVCQAGACVTPNPCDLPGACTAPPPDACAPGEIALHYPATGTCNAVTQSCSYQPTQERCADAGRICQAGVCVEPPNPCLASGVCMEARPPTCSTPTKALTYPLPGQCTPSGGLPSCSYPPAETDCGATGQVCEAGACVTPPDPCGAADVCTTPPADSCPSTFSALQYQATGTCTAVGQVASCDYHPILVDCSAAGQVCRDGACAPADPCQVPPSGAGFLVYSAYAGAAEGYDLRAVKLDGTCDQLLVSAPGDDLSPSWDAGTGRLAWGAARGGALVVATMDLHDGVAHLLDTGPGFASGPALSADGATLVYEGRAPGATSADLRQVPFVGGPSVQVVANTNLQSDSGPALGPTGTIYFVRSLLDAAGASLSEDLYYSPSESGSAVQITFGARVIGRPAISADGLLLAYAVESTTAGSFTKVRIRDLTTNLEYVLSDQGDSEPAFSADGALVAVRTARYGPADIVLLDTATGALVKRLTTGAAVVGTPAFPR